MKAIIRPKLTPEQKRILAGEIKKQIIENDEKYSMENDAITLWVAYLCGFGKKRKLKEYWKKIHEESKRLRERYQLSADDNVWLYTRLLKEHAGIDLEEWYREEKEGTTDENLHQKT